MNCHYRIRSIKTQLSLAMAGVLLFISFSQAAAVSEEINTSQEADPTGSSYLGAGTSNLWIVDEGEGSLTMEFVAPDFQIQQDQDLGKECQDIIVEGMQYSAQPGWPRLPVQGTMLGIPADAEPVLTVLEAQTAQEFTQVNLCPQENPFYEQGPDGAFNNLGQEAGRDETIYQTNRFTPSDWAELVTTGYIRIQRVAQVRISPFQYNPATGVLRYAPRLKMRLSFNKNKGLDGETLAAARVSSEGPFESLLQSTLLNYATSSSWRVKPGRAAMADSEQSYTSVPGYKILVDQDGIYQVTYADLKAAGVDVYNLDPRNFHLFYQGVEAAIQMEGQDDGSFDPGDLFLFYGKEADNKYTHTSAYYLTWDANLGLRIQILDGHASSEVSPSGFMATLKLEQNALYRPNYPSGEDHDRWYWNYIQATSSPASNSYTFELDNLDPSEHNANLSGLLRSYAASPYHHTRVYVNEHLVYEATWNPGGYHQFEAEFSQSYLQKGTNTIRVECPRDGGITQDIIFINRFQIDYWKRFVAEDDQLKFNGEDAGTWTYQLAGFSSDQVDVFDVTDPNQVLQIRPQVSILSTPEIRLQFEQTTTYEHAYIALSSTRRLEPAGIVPDEPSDLRSPDNQADYLVIVPGEFSEAVAPLAELRRDRGLRTQVVKVEDIYDEFSNGLATPQAIRDFLTYAYANWQEPAPTYVLLVGDATYDPLDYQGYHNPTYIPPYLEDVDQWMGEAAADNRFVAVSGSDNFPDMFIGRLPVNSAEETAAVVAKIIGYEQQTLTDGWNARLLLVADNADSGGNFPYYSDRLLSLIPENYSPDKVYYQVTHTNLSQAKADIVQAINQGRLMVNYVGHGAIQQLASEKLFDLSTLPSLTNSNRLPFMTFLTCLAGNYTYASPPGSDYSSLAEELVRMPKTGAVAVWASTGMGLASGQDYLDRGLYQAIFDQGQTRLGAAVFQAKLFLSSSTGGYADLVDLYTLFGDPAMELNLQHNYTFIPLVIR